MIIAVKVKRPLQQVSGAASIKALSGGKSTLQNEIIADLQKEFGDVPDRGEELSIRELAGCIRVSSSSSSLLGSWARATLAKLFAGKLPPSFGETQARELLRLRYGLEEQALDQALLLW